MAFSLRAANPHLLWSALYFYSCSGLLLAAMVFTQNRLATHQDALGDALPDRLHDFLPKHIDENTPNEVLAALALMASVSMFFSSVSVRRLMTRFFLCYGTLMAVRAAVMSVTSFPYPSSSCRKDMEPLLFFSLRGLVGWITGGVFVVCGDMVFSGRAAIATVLMMVIRTAVRWKILRWAAVILAITEYYFLLATHSGYTVEVFITTYMAWATWRLSPELWPWAGKSFDPVGITRSESGTALKLSIY